MTTGIGKRFERYESVADHYLTRRTPVIGRLDGRAFHTLTRYCEKPFDAGFNAAMIETTYALCKEIQGCKLGYTQSDEISLLLIDYEDINTEPWFNYRLNKMLSIAASLASTTFSHAFGKWVEFDARFFNVPENDVCNYFLFRQRDAERNSLNMLAQANYSHKQLQNKNSMQIHEMLHEKGINWNDCPAIQKRGAVVHYVEGEGFRHPQETPEFSKDRAFVENLIPTT